LTCQKLRCKYCPNKDGAIKKIKAGYWSHVLCIEILPHLRFNPSDPLKETIISVGGVPHKRNCEYCNKNDGITIRVFFHWFPIIKIKKCRYKDCKLHYHATCAKKCGLLLSIEQIMSIFGKPPEIMREKQKIVPLLCQEHIVEVVENPAKVNEINDILRKERYKINAKRSKKSKKGSIKVKGIEVIEGRKKKKFDTDEESAENTSELVESDEKEEKFNVRKLSSSDEDQEYIPKSVIYNKKLNVGNLPIKRPESERTTDEDMQSLQFDHKERNLTIKARGEYLESNEIQKLIKGYEGMHNEDMIKITLDLNDEETEIY